MRKKHLMYFVGLLAVGVILFARQSSAQTVTELTECQKITTSGSYRLANNVQGDGFCFSIRTGNITFDGNGKTITSSTGDPLEVADYSNGETGFSSVTITNFTSSGDVRTFGNNINHVTFQNLHIGGITVYGSDDVVIKNNVIGAGGVQVNNADREGWFPLRPTVTENTISGGSTDVKTLVELAGGKSHPCPRIDGQFTNNVITDTRNDPPPEATAAVRIRCATHTTFSNNTVHSTGTTIGLYMRDESDDGKFEGNIFWTHQQEAIRIASGNVDKTFPSRNTFTNNVFRSDAVATQYLQGIGSDNLFQNNLFWGASDGLSQIFGSFGNTWDHNTFYVTGNGSLTTLSYRDGPPPDKWTNNIFSYNNGALFGYDGWAASRYNGDYNMFFNRTGNVSFGSIAPRLADWRTITSADAHSVEQDPLFVDPAAGDFRLATLSPARGRASDGSDLGFRAGATPLPALNTKPTVSIANLLFMQRVTGQRSVTVAAKDSDGIASIIFSIDGKRLSVDRTAPYNIVLDTRPLRNGQHTLTVTAADRLGAQTAVGRKFISSNPLSIQTTSPASGAHVRGIVTLQPKLIYGGSAIRRAGYAVDGKTLKTVYKAPWSTKWDTTKVVNGWHTVTFSLRDTAKTLTKKNIRLYVKN